jgi:hypothetical protein
MINQAIREALQGIAANSNGIAVFRNTLRHEVRAMFPSRLSADIAAVRKDEAFVDLLAFAKVTFGEAYFAAPREKADGSPVDLAAARIAYDAISTEGMGDDALALRKAAQGYVRTAIRQNITMFVPEATDAPKADDADKADEADKVDATETNPTAALAGITAVLVGLSKSNPAAAKALLNGLDSLVKYSRPYVAEGKAIPVKA